ncbi:hypothetical protein EVAR_14925_1 [Eumeta japonica]|uniref:Uncharacterized protein n=1 Tax=Eumeta variegata TaxID=151549 RepID=A0A4C1XQ37_EUMVA|nr:hypothetical protein EVAR_14925_1 [Eumeta japonica]
MREVTASAIAFCPVNNSSGALPPFHHPTLPTVALFTRRQQTPPLIIPTHKTDIALEQDIWGGEWADGEGRGQWMEKLGDGERSRLPELLLTGRKKQQKLLL